MMTGNGRTGIRRSAPWLWATLLLLLFVPCWASAATTYDFASLGAASGGFKPQGNRFLVSESFKNDPSFSSTMYYGNNAQTVSGMTIKVDGENLRSFDLNDMQFLADPGPLTITSLKITATRCVGDQVSVTVTPGTLPSTGSSFKLSDLGADLSSFANVTQLQFDISVETKILSLDFASITISNEVHSPPNIATSFGATSIPLGASTSLTFTLSNPNATTTLQGVAFSDTLPAGLVVASPSNLVNGCGGTATAVAGSSTVSLAGTSLAPAASCTVVLDVTGATAGEKNNSVTVNSTNGGTGNTASETVTVEAADLSLTVSASAPATPLKDLTYTITLTNNGPTFAQNVSITDALPAGTTFKTLSMGGGSGWSLSTPSVGSSGTVTCAKSSVAAGESAIFLLTVQVGADVANSSVISNTATAAALTIDPDPANNTSTAGTTVAYPLRSSAPEYFPTFSAALASVSSPGTIQAWGIDFSEKLTLNQKKTITLRGGYDSGFNLNSGMTSVAAPLTVTYGALTLERLAVK